MKRCKRYSAKFYSIAVSSKKLLTSSLEVKEGRIEMSQELHRELKALKAMQPDETAQPVPMPKLALLRKSTFSSSNASPDSKDGPKEGVSAAGIPLKDPLQDPLQDNPKDVTESARACRYY